MRLLSVTLFNWGVYDGIHEVVFSTRAGGACCLTGETGSGKTTITDAYLALLRPRNADASYNAASNFGSGARRERRTTESYVRGDLGQDANAGDARMCLRPADVVNSAIVGSFGDDDGHKVWCARLMQWFAPEERLRQVWLTSGDEVDCSLLNEVIGTSELNRKSVAKAFPKASSYDGPGKYELAMGRLLGLGSDSVEVGNVTKLLSMIQGEKLPSDVGTLFKDYVLPEVDAKARVSRTVDVIRSEYGRVREMEAVSAHAETLRAMGEAYDALDALVARERGFSELLDGDVWGEWRSAVRLGCALVERESVRASLDGSRQALASRRDEVVRRKGAFDAASEALREARGSAGALESQELSSACDALDKARDAARVAQAESRRAASEVTLASERLDSSKSRLAAAERGLSERSVALDAMVSVASSWARFEPVRDEATWFDMISSVACTAEDDVRERSARERLEEISSEISDIERLHVSRLRREISSRRTRRTRIDERYVKVRAELAEALDVDECDLPFVGELFDMADGFEEWRLATNSAFGNLARRLLVSDDMRRDLQRLVESRKFPFKVSYSSVNVDDGRRPSFMRGGLCEKLEFDESSIFVPYVTRLLSGLDHVCVDSVDKLGSAKGKRYVMRSGQVSSGSGGSFGVNRSTADIIGFENLAQIEDMESELSDYENDVRTLEAERRRLREAVRELGNRRDFVATLRAKSFSDFDCGPAQAEVESLRSEVSGRESELVAAREACEGSDACLSEANSLVSACEARVEAAREAVRRSAVDDAGLGEAARVAEQAYLDSYAAQSAAESEVGSWQERLDDVDERLRSLGSAHAPTLSVAASDVLVEALSALSSQSMEDVAPQSVTRCLGNVSGRLDSSRTLVSARLREVAAEFAFLEGALVTDERDRRYESLVGVAWSEVESRISELGLGGLSDSDDIDHVRLSWLSHYRFELEALEDEWGSVDVGMARRAMCSNALSACASLHASDGAARRDVSSRVRAVNGLLRPISLTGADDSWLEVVCRTDRSGDARELFSRLSDFAEMNVGFTGEGVDMVELARSLVSLADDMEEHVSGSTRCFVDPRSYVRVTFVEHEGDTAVTHSGTGRLSGGEMQQMSACIVGAALLYVMGADAGHKPSYETMVLDEAFVKSDDAHARNTLGVLLRMGFSPVVAMPPTIVMSVSPCLSRLLFVSRSADGRSCVHASEADVWSGAQGVVV